MSWRSLLQPRYLSGERQAQGGVGSKQDGMGCAGPLSLQGREGSKGGYSADMSWGPADLGILMPEEP